MLNHGLTINLALLPYVFKYAQRYGVCHAMQELSGGVAKPIV